MAVIPITIIDNNELDNNVLEKIIKKNFPLYKTIVLSSISQLINTPHKFPQIIIINVNYYKSQDFITPPQFTNNTILIITIQFPEDAIYAYKANALYCIKKPYTIEEIFIAFNKINTEIIKKAFLTL